jgi:hypothetical protein
LDAWPFKIQDKQIYDNLASETVAVAHPVNQNPLSTAITEADFVHFATTNYINPVNIVLFHHNCGVELAQMSEATRSAKIVFDHGGTGQHVSRADITWAFIHPRTQQQIKFAVLEFKRGNAITEADWSPAFNGGEVTGKGAKVCRQLKKYAGGFGTRFVGICDGEKAILLRLSGDPSTWYGDTPWQAPATHAVARYIAKREEIKRNLYLWLTQALVAVKGSHGL